MTKESIGLIFEGKNAIQELQRLKNI